MKNQDLIEQAYFDLKNKLGKAIQWKNGKNTDAFFRLNNQVIFIEAKNEVRPQQVKQIVQQKNKMGTLLVIANYITPNAKELLRKHGINYMDRAGNIYMKLEPVYIHIQGIPNHPPTEDRKNRAFTKTGIKVVFQLLLDPNLVNATYREIAEKADAALGTIPKVIEGLKEEGFLLRKNKTEWILKDQEGLLNRWQQAFTRVLKPALFLKRYKPVDKGFHNHWKTLKLKDQAVWGGEPAADLLTNYLKPEYFTLYTNQQQQEIMKMYRWVPDDKGIIFVYKKFWKDTANEKNHANNLLIYADLIETGDSRCIETANKIYEQYIQKY